MRGDCHKCKYETTAECVPRSQKMGWPKCYQSIVTNSDRIRAMTDEELAEFMVRTGTEYSCPPPHYFGKNEYCQKHLPDCKKCWFDWLKEEAGER